MPETKNEPTPKWTWAYEPAILATYVRDENGVAIARVFGRTIIESAEIARLLAVSPDTKRQRDELLEACKLLLPIAWQVTNTKHRDRIAALILECDATDVP